MNKVLKIAWANFREHPARVALTSLAMSSAACLVIWIASGYEALLVTFDEYSNLALGRYSLAIAPIATTGSPTVPPDVAAKLNADPAVLAADPMGMERYRVTKVVDPSSIVPVPNRNEPKRGNAGPANAGPNFHGPEYDVLSTASLEPPFDMVRGRWINSAELVENAVVLRADCARRLDIDLGQKISVGSGPKKRILEVVGIVGAPTLSSPGAAAIPIVTASSGELYVSPELAERLAGTRPPIRLVGVSLRPEADITKFRFAWAPRLSQFATPVQFQEAHDIEEALDQAAAAQNVLMQSYAAAGIAFLVAMLIVFSTLSMGVNERIRQLAMLRAIAFTRNQIRALIVLESVFLAVVGFVGGVVLGALLLLLIASVSAKMLYHGIGIGTLGLTLAASVTFGGALLAAIGPAMRATRVRPLEAMGPNGQPRNPAQVRFGLTATGLLLMGVCPLLAFAFPPQYESSVPGTMAVAFASLIAGVLLIAPAVVAGTDRLFSPILGFFLRIDFRLLRSQITTHLWRTVGASASLAVGMGLFVAIQVWGYTMLTAFVPGPWAPDALIAFRPDGLPLDHIQDMATIPGIDPRRCQPIVVEQPRFADDITDSAERASVTRQDNLVIVGIDPEGAFGTEHGLFKMDWVAGSPPEAVTLLKSQKGCVVPDHFLTETGLHLGDTIELVPPESPGKTVRYTIAGAVKLPGWHWQTKLTGFRSRTHRAAALVFASYSDVATDFQFPTATHIWFNYDTNPPDSKQLATVVQDRYERIVGRPVGTGGAAEGVPSIRVMPVENIRQTMLGNASRWIWLISLVPLLSMAIAGIGVMNVMFASVRARRWEMGVLKSVGFTGGTLVRVVLAERVLIGVVSCLLSLLFGVLAGWCGCEFSQYVSFFGGLHPPLVMPVLALGFGMSITVAVAVLATLFPALRIGRTRPLVLLQEGRGAF